MKKIDFLITGGSGFLGSSIANYLLKKNYKILIFDNNSRGKLERLLKSKNLFFIKGDIKNFKDLNKCSKYKIGNIIHMAYINGTKNFYKYPIDVMEVAYYGMINILNFSIKNNIKKFFLASSSEVYGKPKRIPTDERETLKIEDVFNPRFSYAGGKIFCELIASTYRKKFNKLIIFRPHNIFGADMGKDHVVPEIIEKIKNSKKNKISIIGTGNETRAFMYVEDFSRALYTIIKRGQHMNIYNIGIKKETKIINLIKLIIKAIGKKIKIEKIKNLEGSPGRRCPNVNKLAKLGFKPKYSLSHGIRLTLKKELKNQN